jgi:hypothetical protein
MNIKGLFAKCGQFIERHKTAIVGILGPAVLAYIANELGLESNNGTWRPKEKKEKNFFDYIHFNNEDPVSIATVTLMRSGQRSTWDRGKIEAARKIFNLLTSDGTDVTDARKSTAIEALHAILNTTSWDTARSEIEDFMASVAALKTTKKPETEEKPEEPAAEE